MRYYQNPILLPEQWPHSGIGDPFILRHNGRYYLYPSTAGDDCGVRVWVSTDLVAWESGGYVTKDECLKNAYAPEVLYYNGRFLMVTSPNGDGHYLYASDSPAGPFKQVRDNFGLVIDGSLFLDDDGQLYFTHAEYPSIHGHTFTPKGEAGPAHELFGACMDHWTEGSMIVKRGGKYYITMTGNHLLSRAYRVQYAISDVGPLGPYRVPKQKTLLVNTDHETGSLGHSSTVIGPDLDSYWIAYHRFPILEHGRRHGRFLNLDRMLFDGEKLLVSGPTNHPCPAPELPDFFAWADEEAHLDSFIISENSVLTKAETPADYTAEICAVPGDDAEIRFGQTESGHSALRVTGRSLTLVAVANGQEKTVWTGCMFEGFRSDALHTFRLECRGGRVTLLIDHMTKAQGVAGLAAKGKLGTVNALRTSFAAFSRHVNQRGDFEHFHAVPGPIEAALFLPPAMNGCGGHQEALCGVRPEDGMRLMPGGDGAMDVLLDAGEFVGYRINAAKAEPYRLQALLLAPEGALLSVTTGENTLEAAVPPMGSLQSADLGEIALRGGLGTLQLSVKQGSLRLRALELFPKAQEARGEWSGLPLCHAARRMEGWGFIVRHEGLQMDRPVQALATFGSRWQTDGWIEADMIFRGDGREHSAGLFLRLSEDSWYPDQVKEGHRGYYIGFDMDSVFLKRLDFGSVTLAAGRCALTKEQQYTLKAEIAGGEIRAYVDGELVLTAREDDPLPFGRVGVGSFGARMTVTRAAFFAR